MKHFRFFPKITGGFFSGIPLHLRLETFIAFSLLASCLLTACGDTGPDKKEPLLPVVIQKQVALYQSYVDSVLSKSGDHVISGPAPVLSKDGRDKRVMAYQKFLLGYKAYKTAQPELATALYKEMLPRKIKDTASYSDLITLQQCGLLQLKVDSFINAAAFRVLVPVLNLNDRYPSRYRWWAYHIAAMACYRIGDLEKSVDYVTRGLRSIPDTSDYGLRSRFLSQFSRIAARKGNFKEAMQWEDSVTTLARLSADPRMLAISKSAKAILYIKLGDKVRGYRLQLEAHEEKKKLGVAGQIPEYLNMAVSFFNEKNYLKALRFGHEAFGLAKAKKDEEYTWRAGQILYNVFYEQKNFDSFVYYYAESHAASIRQIEQQKAKQFSALRLQYQLDQQTARSSRLVLEKKAKESQNQMIIGSFSVVFLMAAIITGAHFRQRKLKTEKDRLQAEKKKAELEQRLLRSQMDPHFIYNSIFAVQDVIRKGEKQEAITFLNDFAGLLRISLHNSRQPFVLLHDELKALEAYLRLQELRLGHLFSYELQLYDGYEEDFDLLIPPMLIQPFVENAINHGMQNLEEKGRVVISIEKDGCILHCTIEDNGNGLTQQQSTGEGNYLSVTITRERLQKLEAELGERSDLKIINKMEHGRGSGVLVELDIPYLLEKD